MNQATAIREAGGRQLVEVYVVGLPKEDAFVALRAASSDDGAVVATHIRPPGPYGIFRCEGEYWTIALGGDVVRLRDAKGLRYLSELLRRPGREVHVLDLVAGVAGVATDRSTVAEAAQAGLGAGHSGISDAPDSQARAAYRARIRELEADISEADARGERDRLASLREEQQLLVRELARGLGLGSRPGCLLAERARVAVTNAIRRSLNRMRTSAPSLARHFERSVRTGVFCSYALVDDERIFWRL